MSLIKLWMKEVYINYGLKLIGLIPRRRRSKNILLIINSTLAVRIGRLFLTPFESDERINFFVHTPKQKNPDVNFTENTISSNFETRQIGQFTALLMKWDLIVVFDHQVSGLADQRIGPTIRFFHGLFSDKIVNGRDWSFGNKNFDRCGRSVYSRILFSSHHLANIAIERNPVFQKTMRVVGDMETDKLTDKYNFFLTVHPNEYKNKKDGQTGWGDYLQTVRQDGFRVLGKKDTWYSYLAASDIVISDNTSLVLQSAIIQRPPTWKHA